MEFRLENLFMKIIFSWKFRFSRKEDLLIMRPVTVLSSLSAVYFFTLLQKRWIHQHSWVLFIRIWAQTPHNSTVTDSFSLKVYVCVWGVAVSRECYYQGEDSRTRSHQHASACSVNPDSSDVALSSAKGHGFVRASLPGDRRAEWWWTVR